MAPEHCGRWILSDCNCASIGADPTVVRRCEHFHYFRGDRRLVGVNHVIAQAWPIKRNWEDADPQVLENARERGAVTDDLFSAWLQGTLDRIPAGTRQDAVNRFKALMAWWPSFQAGNEPDVQCALADEEIVGIPDVIVIRKSDVPHIVDLKNVSSIDPTAYFQLGGYAELYQKQYGAMPGGAGFIHVTQPKDKPVRVQYIEVNIAECFADWMTVRAMWNIVKRRTNGKALSLEAM